MFDDDGATLAVGFAIDTAGSFDSLMRLQAAMGSTEASVLADANRIEKATGSMVNLAPATAAISAFGPAATRELRAVAIEAAAVERSGEGMVRQLERQAASFGKTRDELRALRAEEKALAADRVGNSDLAERIRAAEASIYDQQFAAARRAKAEAEALAEEQMQAAQKAAAAAGIEAQARRSAAHAYDLFEAAARRGMVAYREQQALEATAGKENEAQAVRSAAAAYQMFEARVRAGAQAMREEQAATERDAAALANLRAMIDPAAAAQSRLNAELSEARRLMTAAGASADELAAAEDALYARASRATQQHDLMATAARKNGFALQTIALQLPDITQGLLTGQPPMTVFIQQGFQIVQVAQMAEGGLRGFGREVAALALRFSPLLIGLAAAGAGFALFSRWVNQGVSSEQLTRNLGEITGGADATKQELFKLKDATITWADTSKALFSEVGKDIASAFVGDMKAMGKDVKSVLDDMTSYGRSALAGIYAGVAGMKSYLGEIEKGGFAGLGKMLIGDGDPKLLEKTFGAAYDQADQYLGKLGARVKKAAIENARARIAEGIGFNNPAKPKTDKHAEQLERESRAIEAQIRNLYGLADAYGVSGAAALIAEARVKAESEAIKKRADIEERVAQQVRLAVAQRVSDAAKSTAGMRDQITIQQQVNAEVAAGTVPAALANDLMRDRIEDLPLLAALEAARIVNDVKGAKAASDALDAQRATRERLTDSQREAQRLAAMASGADRLDELKEELRLVGATEEVRVRALATLRATQEATAAGWTGTKGADHIAQQVAIAMGQFELTQAQDAYNAELSATADLFDLIDSNAQRAASGIAEAFGSAGAAVGDMLTIMTGYYAKQARLQQAHAAQIKEIGTDQRRIDRENYRFALESSSNQVGAYGDMASAAKGFFKEGSAGYKALATAEKVFRVAQLAMSLQAMVQNAAETLGFVAGSTARATAAGAEGIATQSKLPFPANIVAMAATGAALVAAGIAIAGGGGGGRAAPVTNTGTGTVLGDSKAQSESLKRSIEQLRDVDTLTNTFARQMAGSLRSIDSQIGGLAAVLVRSGNVSADSGVSEGFKTNAIGSILGKIPLVGGILSSLFGSKTSVIASGLYGGAQSVGQIRSGGFDAATYSDVEKKKKFFGITTGTSYSTQYGQADANLEQQFTLILRSFATSIADAAVPLGEATSTIESRLNGFVVNIGKIDLKGLTGTEIQEKLEAVFGAAADGMANAAFPGIERFQKVGEGAFETLVRVASTAEAVTNALAQMGSAARSMSLDAKLGLADQFDSIGDLTSAIGSYFEAFYTPAEQAAAKTAQLARVFDDLDLAMPATLTAYRALVDAQDLNTASGQAAYATLIQLAPAFAELQETMAGAKSAVDVAAERADLERQLLELRGDTAAIRALELAKLDASNRDLQEQIYAIQDAKEAAAAADELRQAWTSVGDSIMDEVERIRGLTGTSADSFASILGRFNAANDAARGGDLDAAKTLPQLSQALLTAAADAATSRQELDRVRAQTAAQLEATYDAIGGQSPTSAAALLAGASTAQAATSATAVNDDAASELRELRLELAGMREESKASSAAIASNTGRTARTLDSVTAAAGGEAIATVIEAAAA